MALSFRIVSYFIRLCQDQNATCRLPRLQVESVQGKFPDCMAKRQVAPGKWQYLRIEFEYESKNFKLHGHDPKGCDMIVCWRHNWKECPAEIEVVELSRLVGWR